MEITGRIIQVLPEVGGTSKAGNEWKKQEYILETQDAYPKKICFQIFGADRIKEAAIQAGETLTVSFDIESREYQGRWFTNINAWKVDRGASAGQPISPMDVTPNYVVPSTAPTANASGIDFDPSNQTDDLPF